MAQDDALRSPAHPLIESDHIEGTAVYDADGKRIGTIKRLVIEKVSSHVAYAVTTLGGSDSGGGSGGRRSRRRARGHAGRSGDG